MGFKLGSERGNYAVNGELKTKLRFDKESGDPDLSVPGTPVIRKPLGKGIMGEANMDGTIYLSDKIDPHGEEATQTLLHEMRHSTDMKVGKLSYQDDHIMFNGERFERQTIKGKDMILVDGKWTEAGGDFPWERDAEI